VTVDSADGRRVTVERAERIVVLRGNIAEVVVALGLADRVVGRDVSTTVAELDGSEVVTRAHDVSAESVLSLRPDIVLADTDTGPPEALDHLRSAGVAVVTFRPATRVDQIGPRIREIAAALGMAGAGEAVASETIERIEAVTDAAPRRRDRPTVAFLYLRGPAGVYLLGGPGSGADSMVAAAGGVDAGTRLGLERAFTPLTAEALVAADPDVLLMTTTGLESVGGTEGLLGLPGVAQTAAARTGRIATVEDGLLYSFGTRTPVALEQLADRLHADTRATGGSGER
jgi:iron complex transport system substrate-binding protein